MRLHFTVSDASNRLSTLLYKLVRTFHFGSFPVMHLEHSFKDDPSRSRLIYLVNFISFNLSFHKDKKRTDR